MIEILNTEINIWAILLAVVANMVIGILWFGPLFGNYWLKLVNKDKSELQAQSADYLLANLAALIIAIFLSILSGYTYSASIIGEDFDKLLFGELNYITLSIWTTIIASVGFVIPTALNSVIWEGKSWSLYFLNAAHFFISILVMSLIVCFPIFY